MSLQEEIRSCNLCPLHKLMETTPIPPEWSGFPNVMFIIDVNIGPINDFDQSPIVGVVKARFLQLINNHMDDWYITPIVKCRPKNTSYPKKNLVDCSYCLKEEIKRLNPKVLVACGSRVDKIIQCDFICKTPSQITANAKSEKEFESVLKEIKEKINANQSQQVCSYRL